MASWGLASDRRPILNETRASSRATEGRPGIHAGTLIGSALAWIPGQARDDSVVPQKISKL